jgi:hypothetical protein
MELLNFLLNAHFSDRIGLVSQLRTMKCFRKVLRICKVISQTARREERRGACRVLVGKPGEKRSHGRPRRRWIFRKWDEGTWIGLIWLRTGIGGGLL